MEIISQMVFNIETLEAGERKGIFTAKGLHLPPSSSLKPTGMDNVLGLTA
jgi:hypothetical protein